MPLVRSGEDAFIRQADGGHIRELVLTEMLLQICRYYTALPDPRTMSDAEIRFFFEGIRAELRRATAEKPKEAR